MNDRKSESGNVLFLILIAVALFAALSYAVTSSSRSGGGDANDETDLISSSTVTQYPASVRTAIIRMQVSKGADLTELEFNPPADFSNCETVGGVLGVNCVFHPDGGAATFVPGAADVMAGGAQADWVFNSENQIDLVGRSSGVASPAANSADIIAFLSGIKKGICERINDELGITGVPTEASIDVTTQMVNTDGSSPPGIGAGGDTIGDPTSGVQAGTLDGQAFGCFQQPAGTYHYYHVLIEQ